MSRIKSIIKKIKAIIKGWWFLITDNKTSRLVSEPRIKICNNCEYKNKLTNSCELCGCFIPAKTRVIEEECPNNMW